MTDQTAKPLYSGPIVDAHIHLFALNDLSYWWLSGPRQIASHPFLHDKLDNIRRPYYLDDLKNDAKNQNVVKFVHIQCECDDAMAETKFLESVATSDAALGAIIPYANLADPNIDSTLASYAQSSHVRGIRQLLNFHPTNTDLRDTAIDHSATDSVWIANYALLGKYNLHYEFHGFAQQLPAALKLARQYLNIPMVINHTGLIVDFDDDTVAQWKSVIRELGQCPNVSIKISGLLMINHHHTLTTIQSMIAHVIDSFTVDRCMVASNFPIEKAVIGYDELMALIKESVREHSYEDQKKMFHDNAVKFYRLTGASQ